MVLFVGAHRPDRKPVFRVFRVFGFPGFRVFRCSGRSAGQVCRKTGDSESRFAAFPVPIPVSVPVSAAAAGEELLFRTSSAPDAPGPPLGAVRDPAAGCFGCFTSGFGRSPFISDAVRGPGRSGCGCVYLPRRRQRLSPLPEIRWRCMRERSLSTFICATSSSS